MKRKILLLFNLLLFVFSTGCRESFAQQKKINIQINAISNQLLYASNHVKGAASEKKYSVIQSSSINKTTHEAMVVKIIADYITSLNISGDENLKIPVHPGWQYYAIGKKEFEDFDLMMMYSDFLECKTKGRAKGYLKLLPATRFGPPEKSYYTEDQITNIPGIISNNFGKGKSVFIPWLIGTQYNFKAHYAHKELFISAMKNLLKINHAIITNASPLVEMTWMANRNVAFEWIGMLNNTGQIGTSLQQPVVIHNTTLRFKPLKPVKEIKVMRAGTSIDFKQKDGRVECVVPEVNDFGMIPGLYN